MKSQLTLVAAVFFGAMGGSFLTRVIEPAQANTVQSHKHRYQDQISFKHDHDRNFAGNYENSNISITRETSFSR